MYAIIKPIKKMSIIMAVLCLSACASMQVAPQYVSPSRYQTYDCSALQQESHRIHGYIHQTQKQQGTLSATDIGIGVSAGRYGVYPSISFGIGKSQKTQARDAKLAQLYGERDAIIQSGRMKKCAFVTGLKLYGE